MSKPSRAEQETIIIFNEESSECEIYTHNTKLKNRLAKFASNTPIVVLKNEDEYSQTYICPKKYIKVQMPRQYSDETKEKMKAGLQARKNKSEV